MYFYNVDIFRVLLYLVRLIVDKIINFKLLYCEYSFVYDIILDDNRKEV